MASLAAQQYYVEFGSDLNTDRINSLLPQFIPDSCLAGSGMKEKWFNMIVKAYKEVRITLETYRSYVTLML